MRYRPIVAFAPGLLWAVSLAAQSAVGRVLVTGGSATDLRGVHSAAYSLAPSVILAPGSDLLVSFGGRGTRFDGGEWSLGGNGALMLRRPLGAGVSFLINATGDAIRTSYRATYLSADGVPALEWRGHGVSLWGGARLAVARSALAGGRLPGVLSDNVEARSQAGPAFGAGIERQGAALAYREEHGRPDGVRVVDRVLSAGFTVRDVGVAGSVGRRSAPDENRFFGGARLSLRVLPGLGLIGSAESYPSNRLTGTVGGRAVSVGLSLSFGGPRAPRALPRPSQAPPPLPGLTRLSLAAPDARRVEVAGDWNGWHPEPLTRSANGVWYGDLEIPAGVYRYAFRVDGNHWDIPPGVAAVNDGFGGKSAWLTVREPARTATQSANRKEAP